MKVMFVMKKKAKSIIRAIKQQPKYLSVPKIVYFILGLVSVALLLPNELWGKIGINPILANIGYSLLASDVAGILFDIGTNYTNEKNDIKVYNGVTLNHSSLIFDLYLIAEYTCEYLEVEEREDMNLYEMLRAILYEGRESEELQTIHYRDSTEDFARWIKLVKESTEDLFDKSFVMYNNKNFNEKKRTKYRLLISLSKEAIEQFGMETIENNKNVYKLIDKIIKIFLLLYPENEECI